MINTITLVGRITKDPELKATNNNISVTQFTLAVNRSFKNDSGETEADFIRCIAYRAIADNLCKFSGKGRLLGITGELRTRQYEDKDGKTVHISEVLCNQIKFLDYEKDTNSSDNNTRDKKDKNDVSPHDFMGKEKALVSLVSEDDLPF